MCKKLTCERDDSGEKWRRSKVNKEFFLRLVTAVSNFNAVREGLLQLTTLLSGTQSWQSSKCRGAFSEITATSFTTLGYVAPARWWELSRSRMLACSRWSIFAVSRFPSADICTRAADTLAFVLRNSIMRSLLPHRLQMHSIITWSLSGPYLIKT